MIKANLPLYAASYWYEGSEPSGTYASLDSALLERHLKEAMREEEELSRDSCADEECDGEDCPFCNPSLCWSGVGPVNAADTFLNDEEFEKYLEELTAGYVIYLERG